MIESEYLIDHIQYSSRKFSNRIAIIEEETSKQLTYLELWNKIETVSEILRTIIQIPTSEPLTPLVSILTRRSLASVVGKLSILNVGGAYVPVDPSFPHERQIHIFTHSKSQLLLVDESNVNYVKSFPVDLPPIIVMDNEGNIVEINSALQLLPSQIPRLYPFESLAYVLYTSGSTGKPKGVMVHNSGLVNVLKYFVNRLHLTEHDSVLALTTFCFDISMLELFMPLFIGGKVVIVSEKTQKNPVKIIQTLEKYRISTMQATPTTYEMLFSCGWNGNKNIQFLVGGEAFRLKLLPLISNCKKCFNVYGPTETTIWSSCYEFPPLLSNEMNSKKYSNNNNNDQEKDKPMMLVPIGQPIDQTIFYLVNEEMKEITEDNVEGELLIGGIGVASGYLHAPDLTSVRFFDNPFQSRIVGNDAIDHRVYRTGDIVKRIRIDDQIQYVFCRRIDDQVKVNGYRIELREIEIVFENYPKIHQIIVLVIQDQLVAFILLQSITIFDYIAQQPLEYHSLIEELTNHGKKFLPIYMIPKYFQIMKEFPTTANGKLDKLALSNSFQIPPLNSVSNPAAASTSPKGQTSPMKSVISPKSILLTPIRLASPLLGKETNSPSHPHHIDRGSAISMVDHVSDIIHQVTGRKPMVHSTFASVGIDSLAAMMFKNVLSQSLENIEINQQDLYDVHVTIESFCDQLYQQVLQEKPNLLIQLKINRSKDQEKQQQERRRQESLQQDTDDLEDLESSSSRKQRKQQLLQIQNKNNNFISKLLLKNRILLDGIRGFIALLVLLDHYYLDTKYFGIRGHCDTLIFIMLTGITIEFQNLVDEENQRNEEEQNDEDYYRHRHQHHQRNVNHNKNEKNVQWNWKQFLFTRFIGLFPIYWLTLILSIPRLYFLLPKYSSMSSEEWNISISLYILALQTWTKDINTDLFHGVYYVCLIWGVFLMYAYLRSMVFSPSPSSKLWQYYLKRVFFFVLFLIFVWFIHLQTAIGFFHPFFGMIYFLLGLFTTRLFLSMKSFMDSWLKDEDDDNDGDSNNNERDYEYVHVYGWNIYHPAARSSKSSSIAFEWQGFRAPVTASSKKRSRSDENNAREEELQSLLPPTISATSSSYSPSTALLSSTPSPLSTGKGYESFSENMKKSTDETTNSMKIMKNNQDHYKPKLFPKKPSYFLPILIDLWTITFLYLMFNPFLFSNRHTSMYYFIDRFLFLYGFPGMFMILFLLLFYQSIYYSVERSFFTVILTELRIFSLLGECSYPLYLIQFIMVKFWFALAMDGIRDGVFPYTRDYVLHGIHMTADSTDSSASSRTTSHHHHSSTHPHSSSSSSAAATAAAHHAGHERSLINIWYMRLIAIILTIGVAVMIQRIFQEKIVGRLHYHLIQYWRKNRE